MSNSEDLQKINQWYKDAEYVIGIMARRKAYFTEWDVRDIVGDPPPGTAVDLDVLLDNAEFNGIIVLATVKDTLQDGTKRDIWIGV